MKKFLGILLAGFIGFLSIFTSPVNLKNSAEPQYFRNNTVQNAAVITTENNNQIIDFYFDNTNYYGTENDRIFLISNESINETWTIELFSYNLNNELTEDLTYSLQSGDIFNLKITHNETSTLNFGFGNSNSEIYNKNNIDNIWTNSNGDQIKGFRIICATYVPVKNLDLLNPYIGNSTTLYEPETAITQIGSIISDTTNWFVNIFIGLSDVFYSDGQLGVWGSVLFLGVAFTLVSMVLKWVISLIRGI